MTHEVWVNLARVNKVERGTRPHSLLLIFEPGHLDEFLMGLCSGRAMRDGGWHHDGHVLHCPVHGALDPERRFVDTTVSPVEAIDTDTVQ